MDLNLEEFYLDNGLKVVLVERNILPTVSIQIWYKVGAIDEVDGKSGVAHFLEHMAFKGTKNLKPGEFSKIIRALGGNDNAATSWDYTMYYVDIPSEHTIKVLKMMKEVMFDIVFDEKEFNSEKKVILEERRMRYEDNPFGQFFEDFIAKSFKKINYRRPIIGWEEDIKNLKLNDLVEFYNIYYSPKNAMLVVVGNIQKEELKRHIKEIFNESSKNLTQVEKKVENISEFNTGKVEFKTTIKEVKSKAVIVGFRTPSYRLSPKEISALEILSYILTDGRTSRMYKELVVNKKLASNVSGGTILGKYPFLTYFFATANPNTKPDNLKDEIISILNSIINTPPTQDEIKVVKKKIKAERIYEFEKNHGIAGTIGWSEVILGNYKEIDNFIKTIEEVNPDLILQTFKKYFREDNLIIGILEN
ncbi:MAG: insulinase family protein [Brevinematales bacterium]|nr:insulinase family protein [Brevinematales bacterium]